MANLDEIKSSARAELQELRDTEGIFKQVNQAKIAITDEDFEQMVLDKAYYDFDQQENGYKTARQEAYGSIQDQLDMQYWDSVNGTTTWNDFIAQVKADNPKPE